jgi:hypothetical protein
VLTLTIDTLRLQLPAGFEHRAARIGRLLGDALARIDAGPGDLTLHRLAVPPIELAPGASDADVARTIAHSVRHQIVAARRQGDR